MGAKGTSSNGKSVCCTRLLTPESIVQEKVAQKDRDSHPQSCILRGNLGQTAVGAAARRKIIKGRTRVVRRGGSAQTDLKQKSTESNPTNAIWSRKVTGTITGAKGARVLDLASVRSAG